MELAARIVDNFRVSGRGTVQTFEFVSQTMKLRAGDRVQLKAPQGQTYEAVIRGIEHLRKLKPGPGPSYAILLALRFTTNSSKRTREFGSFRLPELDSRRLNSAN